MLQLITSNTSHVDQQSRDQIRLQLIATNEKIKSLSDQLESHKAMNETGGVGVYQLFSTNGLFG